MRTRVTVYNNSIGATILSFVGSAFALIGVALLLQAEIAVALIFILIGIALYVGAAKIADNARVNNYIKMLKDKGYESGIANSIQVACEVYNQMPVPAILNYINCQIRHTGTLNSEEWNIKYA